jgi:hypothetical protein
VQDNDAKTLDKKQPFFQGTPTSGFREAEFYRAWIRTMNNTSKGR